MLAAIYIFRGGADTMAVTAKVQRRPRHLWRNA
jgi:hypothetical protein